MEKLDQKALRTAPVNCKPRLWKRYVDGILEAIKKDHITGFTEMRQDVSNSPTKRSPMAQTPSWTYSSGANPMGMSPQRYTGNPRIPTNICVSGHTIPLTIR